MYELIEILHMLNRINQNTICIDFIFQFLFWVNYNQKYSWLQLRLSQIRSSPNRIPVDRHSAYLKYGHPRIEFQLTATALISNTVNPESNSSWPPQRLSRIRSSPNRITVDRHSAYLEYGHPRIEFQLTATVLISYTVTPNHIISSLARTWKTIPAIWRWNISNVILFTSQE